ncbi:MAG: hypothetical protein JWP27_2727 [Flaviaesturariibacter sp.]|nr:hypothetical protein [Flaviaesturariibacter sp.]
MKQFYFAALAATLLAACNTNDTKTAGYTKEDSIKHQRMMDSVNDSANFTSIQWLDSMHQDLGKVNEGAKVEVSWRFRNTGKKPLIISQATASCGCTVAEKPEEPIAPGAESRIKATFDSEGRAGTNTKSVSVMANTSGTTNHQLSFAVDVQKK